MVPFSGDLSIRPVPSAAIVQRVQAAMENGTNGIWCGTVFSPGSDADVSPMSLFAPRSINTAT
jgi:hypothetical protein